MPAPTNSKALNLDADLFAEIAEAAAAEGRTPRNFIEWTMRQHLNNQAAAQSAS